ncbi:TetR/AcrR family transcriptional regulator [Vannielia litorea]|uniref:TetR/AcrR family transcriptional regulator n=1 Tax=Vannielia TaxID=2813041 RepID=UPI001C96F24F|nr:TetR/AcrR family transcriptional regulator [Vannielia litorea]MBY6047779.1 TetR/AcrR family transcriptional regulator [Vannielia litorea]MBY6075193.1 TetR/AcrR family transcriptional regulator [Vannielia litorea]MBY6152284.1 TetR/AcrR family transcriptional regulator [Vannielia litorea]
MARKTGSHAEITGPKVREAALRLFAQYGYAAVSMRQIAREVGVQAGALYTYTTDKQALLFDLMRDHMTEVLGGMSVMPEGSPGERLEWIVRYHIGYNLSHKDGVFINYMELRNLEPENHKVISGLRRRYEDAVEAVLVDGQEKGVFQIPDTRLASMAVIAMLNGVNTWYREGGRLSQERVERIYWNMVRRAVKGA